MAAAKVFNEFGGYCDPDVSGALHTILNAFEEEDAEAAKEGLNRTCMRDLDIEFTRMLKKIKLPDSADLEAAAANFGAQRAAALAAAPPPPTAADDGPEAVVEEQKKLEEEDEDELC